MVSSLIFLALGLAVLWRRNSVAVRGVTRGLAYVMICAVHIRSLMEQMASLSDALVDVEFEQDWLASHTDRHASSKLNFL
jgi:hypothetical protein